MPTTRDAPKKKPAPAPPPPKNWYQSDLLWIVTAVALLACLMTFQLWGTNFTCDDDLFTATASQRWGRGATGWTAIFRASETIAHGQGRFYQVVPYTLSQLPYHLGSVPALNVVRIFNVLVVFAAFTAMLAELLRNLRLALYFSALSIALLQTTYQYNPFHAYPLWFALGAAFIFFSLFLFSRGLHRASSALRYGSAVTYFCSLLFYEAFILYGIIFFILAFLHPDTRPRKLLPGALRALRQVWPFIAGAGIYLGLYFWYSAAHPTSYPGRSLSLGPPAATLRTILTFSITGLNLDAFLHVDAAWSWFAALVSVLVFLIAFFCLRRYQRKLPLGSLLFFMAFALLGMLLPNVLYGFTGRYREWITTMGGFYLGSFDSAFPCAVLLGAAGLLAVRLLGRARLARPAAAAVSLVFALAAYSNANVTRRFFDHHRDNRRLWDLVENSLATGRGDLYQGGTVLVAPAIERIPPLTPEIYDYWSFYFTGKLGHPCRVVGSPADFDKLPPELRAGRVLGLVPRYTPSLRAGMFAIGPLDLAAWKHAPWQLMTDRVTIGVLGNNDGLSVTAVTTATGRLRLHAQPRLAIEGKGPVDLNTIALE